MLFDLEDYRVTGITGKDHVHVHQIRWDDSMYTQRATFDTYYNTIREYGETAVAMAPASEVSTILEKSFIALEKLSSFRKISKEFWNAMCSIAIVGSFNEGDKFDYTTVNMDVVVDGVDYQDLTWSDSRRIMNPYKFVAFRNENGEFEYRSMTQALYNSYYTALTDSQSAVKTLMLTGEGVSTIAEFVPPLVPAWNDGAELSGYVRDSRSLPISGATVRLVDADGVNHDLVTNDLGYYHFTKEYIYNNISLGTASSAEFDMFVLEETISGTVLYSQTSIFQNSFFGAVNDRGLTWPVLVKSGKQNRRNFKLEFITDYSAYPSLSGTILDQDGNPVANALVELKYYIGQGLSIWLGDNEYEYEWVNIGYTYDKPQGPGPKWNKTTKYTLFGEEKSLLTDENGHYEYPSQLIGQWYNENLKRMWRDLGFSNDWTFSEGLLYNPNIAKNGFHVDDDYVTGNGFCWNGQNQGSYVYASGVQSDGKLIAGGDISCYNDVDLGYTIPETVGLTDAYGYPSMIRLNTDGTLDETFETPIRYYRISNGNQLYDNPFIQCIKVLSGDKILVAGNFNKVAGEHANGLVLLNADGTLDTIFEVPRSNSELQTDSYFSIEYYGTDPMLCADKLSDGRFIAYTSNTDMLYVFNADGTLDTNFSLDFNFGGEIVTDTMGTFNKTSKEIRGILPLDGGFILHGNFNIVVDNELLASHIVKINNDGTLDTSFKCIVGSYYGFDMQNYSNLDILALYSDYGAVNDVVKTSNATLLLSGYFGYTKVYTNGVETDTKVRNLIRIDMDGNLLDKFDNAPDPSSDYENDGDAEMGIPLNGKIQIIDTLNSYPGSMNYYSDNGKKLIIHNKFGSGLWTLDLVTGVSEQTGIFFTNTINTSIVTRDNKLVIFGDFGGYWEEFENGTGVDGLGDRYRYDRFGIVKFEYGAYNHFNDKYVGRSFNITSTDNPDSTISKSWSINDVKVLLNPWVQNSLTGEVYDRYDRDNGVVEPTKIYNYVDWFNSRFAYSFNERNEEYAIKLQGGSVKDIVLDIQEVLTDAESGAELFKLLIYPPTNGGNFYVNFKTTSGYITVRRPDGTRNTFGDGNNSSLFGNSIQFVNELGKSVWDMTIEEKNTPSIFYFYSSEGNYGAATGKIKEISINMNDGARFEVVDSSIKNLSNLENLSLTGGPVELDLTGMTSLKYLNLNNNYRGENIITGIDTLTNLIEFTISDGGVAYSRSEDFGGYEYVIDKESFSILQQYPKISFGGNTPNDIVRLSDGKFLIVGYCDQYISGDGGYGIDSYYDENGLVRLNSDFSVDRTFTVNAPYNNGFKNSNYGWNGSVTTATLGVQSDGKIIVGGVFNEYNGVSVPGLVRLNSDGTMDSSFKFKDFHAANFSNISYWNYYTAGIKVLSDNKILVWGCYLDKNGNQYGILKLNSDGSLDVAYEKNDMTTGNLIIQSDGKIIANGGTTRYNTDGTMDVDFGNSDAHNITNYVGVRNGSGPSTLNVQSDDKFFISFSGAITLPTIVDVLDHNNNQVQISFARFNADGSIDTEFLTNLANVVNNTGKYIGMDWNSIPLFKQLSNGDILVLGGVRIGDGYDFDSCALVLDQNGNLSTDSISLPYFNNPWFTDVIEDGEDLIILGDSDYGIWRYDGSMEQYATSISRIKRERKKKFYIDFPNSEYITYFNNNLFNSGIYRNTDIDYKSLSTISNLQLNLDLKRIKSVDITGMSNIDTLSLWAFDSDKIITGGTTYSVRSLNLNGLGSNEEMDVQKFISDNTNNITLSGINPGTVSITKGYLEINNLTGGFIDLDGYNDLTNSIYLFANDSNSLTGYSVNIGNINTNLFYVYDYLNKIDFIGDESTINTKHQVRFYGKPNWEGQKSDYKTINSLTINPINWDGTINSDPYTNIFVTLSGYYINNLTINGSVRYLELQFLGLGNLQLPTVSENFRFTSPLLDSDNNPLIDPTLVIDLSNTNNHLVQLYYQLTNTLDISGCDNLRYLHLDYSWLQSYTSLARPDITNILQQLKTNIDTHNYSPGWIGMYYVQTSTKSLNALINKGFNYWGSYQTFVVPELPTVLTQAIIETDVEYTNVHLVYAQLVSDGDSTLTEYGFVISTSENPTVSDTKIVCQSYVGSGWRAPITDLQTGTTYYVRAYAINSIGTSYGGQINFTTKVPSAPIVTTSGYSSVLYTQVNGVGGYVNLDGGSKVTQIGMVWGTQLDPVVDLVNGVNTTSSSDSSLSTNISNLVPATTYYVRFYAINSIGIGYGSNITFTTQAYTLPTVEIITPSFIESNYGVGTGNAVKYTTANVGTRITGDGGPYITEFGVCVSTSPNPTTTNAKWISNTKPNLNQIHVPGGLPFITDWGTLSSLTTGTTYYVRAYAITEFGTGYSSQLTFTTKTYTVPTPVTGAVTLNSPSSNGTPSITANFSINSNSSGGPSTTEIGLVWSTSSNVSISNFDSVTTWKTNFSTSLINTNGGYISAGITVKPDTTYYFRAYAINSVGVGYGSEVTFTTDPFFGLEFTFTDIIDMSMLSTYVANSTMMQFMHYGDYYSKTDGRWITNGSKNGLYQTGKIKIEYWDGSSEIVGNGAWVNKEIATNYRNSSEKLIRVYACDNSGNYIPAVFQSICVRGIKLVKKYIKYIANDSYLDLIGTGLTGMFGIKEVNGFAYLDTDLPSPYGNNPYNTCNVNNLQLSYNPGLYATNIWPKFILSANGTNITTMQLTTFAQAVHPSTNEKLTKNLKSLTIGGIWSTRPEFQFVTNVPSINATELSQNFPNLNSLNMAYTTLSSVTGTFSEKMQFINFQYCDSLTTFDLSSVNWPNNLLSNAGGLYVSLSNNMTTITGNIPSTLQMLYIRSNDNMSSAQIDSLINGVYNNVPYDVAGSGKWASLALKFSGRTSASETAYNGLISRGWSLNSTN